MPYRGTRQELESFSRVVRGPSPSVNCASKAPKVFASFTQTVRFMPAVEIDGADNALNQYRMARKSTNYATECVHVFWHWRCSVQCSRQFARARGREPCLCSACEMHGPVSIPLKRLLLYSLCWPWRWPSGRWAVSQVLNEQMTLPKLILLVHGFILWCGFNDCV